MKLKVFSSFEKNKIAAAGARAEKIAKFFETAIMRAQESLQVANYNWEAVQNERDGKYPNVSNMDAKADEETLAAQKVRAQKHLTHLEMMRNVFAVAPNLYGKCEGCGCEIPLERLEEVPDASRCVTCKNGHNGNNHKERG